MDTDKASSKVQWMFYKNAGLSCKNTRIGINTCPKLLFMMLLYFQIKFQFQMEWNSIYLRLLKKKKKKKTLTKQFLLCFHFKSSTTQPYLQMKEKLASLPILNYFTPLI